MMAFRPFALLAAALALFLAAPASAAEVKIDADLGQSAVVSGKSGRVYLRLSVKALAAKAAERRTPVNVALVLDRSGSMQGERIAAAKQAAEMALSRLSSNDTVALIAYNHNVDVLRPASRLGSHTELVSHIQRLQAGGTTALYAGVVEGGREVGKRFAPNQVNRVILLSDGLANVGPSTPKELGELGRKLGAQGVSVTTIGLGLQYNEDLMQRLAAASDGNHAFVEKPSDLVKVFNAEFGDALSIAAQDLTITIECRIGVRPIRVLGREAEIKDNRITLKLNQLQGGNERYIVVELETPAGQAPGAAEIANVEVDYLDLDRNARERTRTGVTTRFTTSETEADESINKDVMSQVTAQIATEASEKAVELRDKCDVAAARKVLQENANYLKQSKERYAVGAAAAAAPSVRALDELEKKNRFAADNLDGDAWDKTRKIMRQDQHRSKVQQTY